MTTRKPPIIARSFAFVASWILLLGLALVPFQAWGQAAIAIVPSANFDVDGNGSQSIPFGTDSFCDDGIRHQQLYDGSQIGGPHIGSMSFRLDASVSVTGPFSYTGVTVRLSSTLATYATMSQTFADNIGPDEMVVYSGELVANPSESGEGTNPFDFDINFMNDFDFDGSGANLLVDITIEGCHGGEEFFLDAQNGDNAVTRIFARDKDDEVALQPAESVGLITAFFVYGDGIVFIPNSMGSGGNWQVVGHNGEGFLFEPLADGRVVIFWFTYDLFGNQMWLLGVSSASDWQTDFETGLDEATVDMFRTSGPSFGPDFNPDDFMEDFIGTATFHLDGCLATEGATGQVDYNFDFGFGVGSYDIVKLYDIYKNDCER
jgi:hypothetical protein